MPKKANWMDRKVQTKMEQLITKTWAKQINKQFEERI